MVRLFAFAAMTFVATLLPAQPPGGFPGGPGGGFGGPPGGQERKLVQQFDKDGDGRLNTESGPSPRVRSKDETPAGRGRALAGAAADRRRAKGFGGADGGSRSPARRSPRPT